MRPFFLFLWLSSTAFCAGDLPLLSEAEKAIQEGLPQVGIQKLATFLAGGKATVEEQAGAALQMAHALILLQKTGEAREWLGPLQPGETRQLLYTQSFLSDGNWQEVLRAVQILPSAASPNYAPTLFARAEARRALGDTPQAEADYSAIQTDPDLGKAALLRRADMVVQSGTPLPIELSNPLHGGLGMAAILSAEDAFLKKDFASAERQFRALFLHPANLSTRAWGSVHLGLARSLLASGHFEEAEDVLEGFIEKRPEDEQLPEVFAELARVYGNEKNPSTSQLRRWSRDSTQLGRQALAIYCQSLVDLKDKGSEAALATLSSWLQKFPTHPLRASVLLRYGEELFAGKNLAQAVENLRAGLSLKSAPEIQGSLHFALARALFASNRFAQAGEQFREAASLLVPMKDRLLYNEALCWLRLGNLDQFFSAYRAFSDLFPESSLRRDLLIEEAFFQARSRQFAAAIQILTQFIRDFPEHSRIPDAHLALAEIALLNPATGNVEVGKELILAGKPGASEDAIERTAYLQISEPAIESDQAGNAKKLALCAAFLKDHPNSTLLPEIHFKMGELYFLNKDYTSAGTQFELISDKFPESSLLEQARFLAGQAAIRTQNPSSVDGAISLFEQVVRMKGPLQPYARFEQAQVKKNGGALDEALVLFDDLLGQNPPPDLLPAALAARGETLYLQGGAKLPEAVNTFSKLAELPGISRYWRNLALYKKGKALGLLEKRDEMLTAFYDVLASPQDSQEVPEFFWFYRAGFEAAELLEAQEQWTAAIAIYKKLANAKGPRSTEATQRIARLRLEHFVWD